MSKKNKIIISIIVVLIILSLVGIIVFGGDKKDNKENITTSMEETESIKETTSEVETESIVETTSKVETESITETTSETETEEPTTEAPTEKPVEKPTETTTTKPVEKPTLSLEEAAKLTTSGSYTEYRFQLGADYGDAFDGYWIVRKTYENGAVRDYLIVDGQECELDSPIGVVPDDYVANSSNGVGVHTGEQQTQSQNNNKVTYKGIYPARSKYSSDAEWKAAVNDAVNKDDGINHAYYFASEADAKLYAQLCQGGPYTGDMEWANMTTEEWLKWCEENGFTVN